LVSALNKVLELAVPEAFSEGGTKIVPARGRISEETDVAEFRDMVAIVRDRVQDGIDKKQTLEQIKASRPTRDYDTEYSGSPGDADRLVEAMYRTLSPPSTPVSTPRGGRQ
jgi:cyclase